MFNIGFPELIVCALFFVLVAAVVISFSRRGSKATAPFLDLEEENRHLRRENQRLRSEIDRKEK